MKAPDKPVGKLSVVGATNREQRTSTHAVWALVRVVDEAGNMWEFSASCFSYDMKPIHPVDP